MDFSNEININCFANLNQAQKDKRLFEAAKDNNTQLIIDLLTAGAEPYFVDEDNNTALHWAAYHGNDKAVQLLLDKKADINFIGLDGYSPLHFAAQEGYISTVRLLYEQGANVLALDDIKNAPIHTASLNGQDEVIKLLLQYKVDINLKGGYGWTPLHCAAKEGHVSTVLLLCENRANVLAINDNKNAPIHIASLNGQDKVIKLFLQYKFDINLKGQYGLTPLHCAVEGGCSTSTIRLLCDKDANVLALDEHKNAPIHIASFHGRYVVVGVLLEYKTDINLKSRYGWTPLHCAASEGCVSTIWLLYNKGANIFTQNKKNQNPFVLALDLNLDVVFFFLFLLPKEKIDQLMLTRPRDDYDKLEKFKTALLVCRQDLKNMVVLCRRKENNILANQPLELFFKQLHMLDKTLFFPDWYSKFFLWKDLNDLVEKYYRPKNEELMICEAEYNHEEEAMVESPSCGKMICEGLSNAASFIYSYVPSFSSLLKRKREDEDSDNANIENTKRLKLNKPI